MSRLLKLTMTDGREILVSVKAAYDAGTHRVINENEGCECHHVLETLEEIQVLNNAGQELALRDQFAMSAMNGLYSSREDDCIWVDKFTEDSYMIADAMLKARKAK